MNSADKFKMFSVDEANSLIPNLRKLMIDLQTKKEGILKLEVEIDAIELVSDLHESTTPPALQRRLEAYESAVNEFYNIIDEIHHMGCHLKDVNRGLINFYSVYNGRVVFLCWCLGEEEIMTWHEIGRSFSHRQPIRADHQSEK